MKLAKYLKPYWLFALISPLMMMAEVAADLCLPYLMSFIVDYGIADDGNVYTAKMQKLIDTVAENGGGVVVVPAGTYLTGALFFKQGVNLLYFRVN